MSSFPSNSKPNAFSVLAISQQSSFIESSVKTVKYALSIYNLTENFERKRWKLSSRDLANSDTGMKNINILYSKMYPYKLGNVHPDFRL